MLRRLTRHPGVVLSALSAGVAYTVASSTYTNQRRTAPRVRYQCADDDDVNDDDDGANNSAAGRIVVGADNKQHHHGRARPTAVVIGGGTCGVATAYALQRRGYAVTVLESDADVATACSRAPAGGMQRSNPTLDRATYATTALSLAQATADRVLPWRWRQSSDDGDDDGQPFRYTRMSWSTTLRDPHFLRWLCEFTWTSLWHNGDVPMSTVSSSALRPQLQQQPDSQQEQQRPQQQQRRAWSAAEHTLAYTAWAIEALVHTMHTTTLPSPSSSSASWWGWWPSSSPSGDTLAQVSGLRDAADDDNSLRTSTTSTDNRRSMGAVKLVYDIAQWQRYRDAGADDERTWVAQQAASAASAASASASASATATTTETAASTERVTDTSTDTEVASPSLQRAAQWQASVSSQANASETTATTTAVPSPTHARWGRFDDEPCVVLSPAETSTLEPWLIASSGGGDGDGDSGSGDGADGMILGAVYQPLARSAHCSAFTRALRRVCESTGDGNDDGNDDVVPVRFVSDVKVTGFSTAPVGVTRATDTVMQRVSSLRVTRSSATSAASTSSSSSSAASTSSLVNEVVKLPSDCVVVVAAGAWTPLLLRRLGLYCPVYPLKGYSVLYDVTVPDDGDGDGDGDAAATASTPTSPPHWSLWWPQRMVADGMTYVSSFVVDDGDDAHGDGDGRDDGHHHRRQHHQQRRQQRHQVRLASIGEFSGWDGDGVASDVRRAMLGEAQRLLPHVHAAAGVVNGSSGSSSDAVQAVTVSPPRVVAGLRPYVADGRPLIGRVTAAVTGSCQLLSAADAAALAAITTSTADAVSSPLPASLRSGRGTAPSRAPCTNLYVNTGPGFNGWKTCIGAGEVLARAVVADAAATTTNVTTSTAESSPLPFDACALSPDGRIVAAPLFARLCDALMGREADV